MTPVVAESTDIHSRLLKCALEVEEARAYWRYTTPGAAPEPRRAFEETWFGAKSFDRVTVLLANFRARFDAYPEALAVLHKWPDMAPDTRALICHWHLQLADPIYRAFTGDFLIARRDGLRQEVTRDVVVTWVGQQGPGRWTLPTRIQFASKLLSASMTAGLVRGSRDPRPLTFPRVTDDALTYAMYLLRATAIQGTLLDNPYLRSVGLESDHLVDRLRALPALTFQRQTDLIDLAWRHPSLRAWADDAHGHAA